MTPERPQTHEEIREAQNRELDNHSIEWETPRVLRLADEFEQNLIREIQGTYNVYPDDMARLRRFSEQISRAIYDSQYGQIIYDQMEGTPVIDPTTGERIVPASTEDRLEYVYRQAEANISTIIGYIASQAAIDATSGEIETPDRPRNILTSDDLGGVYVVVSTLAPHIHESNYEPVQLALMIADPENRAGISDTELIERIASATRNSDPITSIAENAGRDMRDMHIGTAENPMHVPSSTAEMTAVLTMLNDRQMRQLLEYHFNQYIEDTSNTQARETIQAIATSGRVSLGVVRNNIRRAIDSNPSLQEDMALLYSEINEQIAPQHAELQELRNRISEDMNNHHLEDPTDRTSRVLGGVMMIYGGVMALTNFALGIVNPRHIDEAAPYGLLGMAFAATGASLLSGREGFDWTKGIIEGLAFGGERLSRYSDRVILNELESITLNTSWEFTNELFANQTFIETLESFRNADGQVVISDVSELILRIEGDEYASTQEKNRLIELINQYMEVYSQPVDRRGLVSQGLLNLNFVAASYNHLGITTRDEFINQVGASGGIERESFSAFNFEQ